LADLVDNDCAAEKKSSLSNILYVKAVCTYGADEYKLTLPLNVKDVEV
jgi:hypothetical protein